jgi:hypothetical protein
MQAVRSGNIRVLIGAAGSKTICGNDARWAFGLRTNRFMFWSIRHRV